MRQNKSSPLFPSGALHSFNIQQVSERSNKLLLKYVIGLVNGSLAPGEISFHFL